MPDPSRPAVDGVAVNADPTPKPSLTAILLVISCLPSFFFFVGAATSLALGSAVSAALVSALATLYPNRLKSSMNAALAGWALMSVFVLFHLLVASLFQQVAWGRGAGSLILLGACILGGTALAGTLMDADDARVDRSVKFINTTMLLIVMLQFLGISTRIPNGYLKPFFPFTEPSHFALMFMPFYIFTCVASGTRNRLLYLAIGLALILYLESLTLAIGWIIVAFVCARGFLIPITVTLGSAAVLATVNLNYFLDRLDFSGTSQNLSTLVWLQGWQLVDEAVALTSGWGVGFQQLGVQGTQTLISRLIYILAGNDANILDGGFTAAKLLSEFGAFGILVVVTFAVCVIRSVFFLRTAARNFATTPKAQVFSHAIFAAYFIDMFVRGTGYFTGTTILLIAASIFRFRDMPPIAPRALAARLVRR